GATTRIFKVNYSRDWRRRTGVQGLVCTAAVLSRPCPLWVKSAHRGAYNQCLLYPQKRTLIERVGMSALCQKRTHALQQSEAGMGNKTRLGIGRSAGIRLDSI